MITKMITRFALVRIWFCIEGVAETAGQDRDYPAAERSESIANAVSILLSSFRWV
jgi:hypothetical protein